MADESMFNALIRSRLTLRDSDPQLYNDLEARMPLVTEHPNAAATVQGMATPQQIQQTSENVASSPMVQAPVGSVNTPIGTPGAPKPDAGAQPSQLGQLVSKLLEDLNKDNEKKAKPIGPDLFGNGGGILGTGVSVSTALMYALGAAITSRLPQREALAMTMKIGGMPAEYEKNKHDMANSQIQTIISAINGQTAQENLQQRSTENNFKNQAVERQQNALKFMEEKLSSGQPMNMQDRALAAIRAKEAGVDPAIAKEIFLAPDLASQLSNFELVKQYAERYQLGDVSGSMDLPMGQKIDIGKGKVAGTTNRTVTPTELKLFADTGVKGPSIPADLTREAAQQAVSNEQSRQVVTAGGKAGAVAANTPPSPEAQEKLLNFGNFVSLLENVSKGLKDEYVGPVRGRTYGLARQGIMGFSKPKEEETKFRADLENLKSLLVLARSGAAAAEPEFARLGGVIGEPTDDPKVFKASVNNMLKQAKELQAQRKTLINTPKGAVAAGAGQSALPTVPPGAGKRIE